MKLINYVNIDKVFFENTVYDGASLNIEAQLLVQSIKKKVISDSPFIHLVASNNVKTVISLLAILKLDKIVVVVDPLSTEFERREYNRIAPPCATIIPLGNGRFDYDTELQINENTKSPDISSDLTDVQFVFFTDAENGTMKAVMLTWQNMLSTITATKEGDVFFAGRTCCGLLPFAHLFGLITGVLAPAISGGNIALYDISKYQEFRTMTKFIHDTGVTNLYSSPLMFYFFTKVPDIGDMMENVRALFAGGIRLERAVYDSFYQKTGKQIHEGYGLTEACGMVSTNQYGMALMPDTIGTALSHGEIGLFDAQGNQVTEKNITAEICVKNQGVMRGFLNNEKATSLVLKNGWLHTGDLGHFVENKYIVFDGMKKRMLNAAGINVYPAEIERFIKQNLSIVDSIEVFGEHKPMLGHSVMANITLTENTPENQKMVKDWALHNLSSFKVPKRWNFISE